LKVDLNRTKSNNNQLAIKQIMGIDGDESGFKLRNHELIANLNSDQGKRLVESIRLSGSMVVLCGAGISVSAGIKAFRGVGGINNEEETGPLFDCDRLYSKKFEERINFYTRIAELRQKTLEAKPTITHHVMAQLLVTGQLRGIITQNIDGLEKRALQDLQIPNLFFRASLEERVLELHGNLDSLYCPHCGLFYNFDEYCQFLILKARKEPRCPTHVIKIMACEQFYPHLEVKPGKDSERIRLRPTVQLYNERLKEDWGIQNRDWSDVILNMIRANEDYVENLIKAHNRAGIDYFLIIGTSLDKEVQDAMLFTQMISAISKRVIYIDPSPKTPDFVDYHLQARCDDFFRLLQQ